MILVSDAYCVRANFSLTIRPSLSLVRFLVTSVISNTQEKKTKTFSSTISLTNCEQCGGIGYMKTKPNCYHTCLKCLGRGVVSEKVKEKLEIFYF